jgi:protein FrlC
MTGCRVAACNSQYTRRTFADFIETQKKLGVRDIEFIAQVPHFWCDHIEREETAPLIETLGGAGIKIAAFTPKLYRYSIYAPLGSLQREYTISYMKNAMEAARSMASPLFCVENGGACFDIAKDELWNNCSRTLAELCRLASDIGVNAAIGTAQPEDSPILTTLAELARMKNEIGCEKCGVILDVRLISVSGESISEWFDAFGDDIALVRFTDGNYNGYRPWGEGCLPCGRFLDDIAKGGYGGVLSQYRRGERETRDPAGSDERNYRYLMERLNVNEHYQA